MNKYFTIFGGVLIIVIMGFAYSQYSVTQELREAFLAEQEALSALTDRYSEEKRENLQEIAELRNQLRNNQRDLAVAREAIQDQQQQRENDQFQGGTANRDDSVFAPGPQGPRRSPFNMMSSPRMQELTARMQVNNRYGPFMNSLDLSPEEREELNGILMDIVNEQQALQMQMASGEITMQEFQEAMASLDMEETLNNFLTDEEANDWYDWQAQEGERMQQQARMSINMQLSMQTPGLTEENRSRLAGILTEQNNSVQVQSRAGGPGLGGVAISIRGEADQVDAPGSGGPQNGGATGFRDQMFSSQLQQYDNIRRELEGTMDEGQMAIVNSYLEQQELQVEFMQEMMSSQNGGQGVFTGAPVFRAR